MLVLALAAAASCCAVYAQELESGDAVVEAAGQPPQASEAESTKAESANAALAQGLASWYGPGFHGRRTANGERFNMNELTAAHRTLPFGTLVLVRSLVNGRTVQVRINDRGPYLKRRVIDLSRAAATALGLIEAGTGTKQVELAIVGFSARRS